MAFDTARENRIAISRLAVQPGKRCSGRLPGRTLAHRRGAVRFATGIDPWR
jgi:hypothetical protein